MAIRAHVPLDVLRDTIQPFPTFSEIYADALKALRATIAAAADRTGRSPHRSSFESPSARAHRTAVAVRRAPDSPPSPTSRTLRDSTYHHGQVSSTDADPRPCVPTSPGAMFPDYELPDHTDTVHGSASSRATTR